MLRTRRIPDAAALDSAIGPAPAVQPRAARWLAQPDAERLKLRVGDHACLIDGVEYHVHADTGVIEVKDYSHPQHALPAVSA